MNMNEIFIDQIKNHRITNCHTNYSYIKFNLINHIKLEHWLIIIEHNLD